MERVEIKGEDFPVNNLNHPELDEPYKLDRVFVHAGVVCLEGQVKNNGDYVGLSYHKGKLELDDKWTKKQWEERPLRLEDVEHDMLWERES